MVLPIYFVELMVLPILRFVNSFFEKNLNIFKYILIGFIKYSQPEKKAVFKKYLLVYTLGFKPKKEYNITDFLLL